MLCRGAAAPAATSAPWAAPRRSAQMVVFGGWRIRVKEHVVGPRPPKASAAAGAAGGDAHATPRRPRQHADPKAQSLQALQAHLRKYSAPEVRDRRCVADTLGVRRV